MAQTYADGNTSSRTDGSRSYDREVHVDRPSETRRAFKTTEFFAMLGVIAAIIVVGYASDDSLDAARIWTLVAVVASAYMVSRGLAKAGSYERNGREVTIDDRR